MLNESRTKNIALASALLLVSGASVAFIVSSAVREGFTHQHLSFFTHIVTDVSENSLGFGHIFALVSLLFGTLFNGITLTHGAGLLAAAGLAAAAYSKLRRSTGGIM